MNSVLISYFNWHYGAAYGFIADIWKGFRMLCLRFFSVSFLTRTLFMPLMRIHDERENKFDLAELGAVIFTNTVLRLVGFILRLIIISIGFITWALSFVLEAIALAVWMIMPMAAIVMLITGVLLVI